MSQTTTNDLIRYLFNETELTNTVLIQNDIEYNYFVHEEFEELKESLQLIDDLMIAPAPQTIQSIMSYSALTKNLIVA